MYKMFIKQIFFLNIIFGFSFSQDYIQDTLAVRAILDSNEFFTLAVDSVSDSSNGRIDTLILIGAGKYATLLKELITLPSEIGKLTKLKYLDLWINKLTNLPNEIGNLDNLEFLNCGSNCLDSLPTEIGNLFILKHFYIDHNSIKKLPKEMGNLSKLTALDLGYNKLRSIPKEIGKMKNLLGLWLNSNTISELPGDIGQLSKITTFHIQNNCLSSLPKNIANLKPTFNLNVAKNYLDENELFSNVVNWLDKYAGGWRNVQNNSTQSKNYLSSKLNSLYICYNKNNLLFEYNNSYTKIVKLEIFNSKGEKVFNLNEFSNISRTYLDLTIFSSGTYFMNLITNGNNIKRKFVLIQ